MFVFGGVISDGTPTKNFYRYDLANNQWSTLNPANSNIVNATEGGAGVATGLNRILVFRGKRDILNHNGAFIWTPPSIFYLFLSFFFFLKNHLPILISFF